MRKYIVLFLMALCFCSCDNKTKAVRPWDVRTSVEKKSEKKERKKDSIIENSRAEYSSVKSSIGSSTYKDDDESSGSKYTNYGHPGTKPDDGLFGFDPYDDEDDAYDVERNQVDPYPDEW